MALRDKFDAAELAQLRRTGHREYLIIQSRMSWSDGACIPCSILLTW